MPEVSVQSPLGGASHHSQVFVPTIFENYVMDVAFKGLNYELALWDTAGQEDYDRLRPLSYRDTDVLLVCFAIDWPASLDNVWEKASLDNYMTRYITEIH